jgi:hypothetical protein
MNVNQLIRGLLVIVLATVLSCDRKSEESAKPNDVPAVLSPEVTLENGHVTLDWKKALYFDYFYEVPFELNGKVARPVSEKMGMNEGRSRLLYSRKSTDEAVFVVNYIPSKAFKGDINAVNTQNFLSLKFDGRITLSRIGDNTLRVLEINNGKVTKDAKHQKVSRQDAGRARTSGCELWVDTIDWYTCSGGECHYNYTAQEYYYVCTGDPFGGDDYTGGTSNGDCSSDPICNGYGIGSGAATPVADVDLTHLTNDCMINAYNQLANAGLTSQVLRIAQSFGKDKNINLIIRNDNLGNPNLDASTSILNRPGNIWEITLNDAALSNASSEYIAATIIHEILHVYLDGGNDADHNVMAANYVYPMADALKAAGYHLTYEDAVALAWGGLQGRMLNGVFAPYQAWQELLNIDRISGTHVTNDIAQKNQNYKSNNYGQRCN